MRTARIIAERLGCMYREVSGNHVAFISKAATLAVELQAILDEMKSDFDT